MCPVTCGIIDVFHMRQVFIQNIDQVLCCIKVPQYTWQLSSIHNTRTIEVEQLNGTQPSLLLLYTFSPVILLVWQWRGCPEQQCMELCHHLNGLDSSINVLSTEVYSFSPEEQDSGSVQPRPPLVCWAFDDFSESSSVNSNSCGLIRWAKVVMLVLR